MSASGGKYRVHPPMRLFDDVPIGPSVPFHVMENCAQECGCGQVTCPCMETAECADRNYYCCDGRMKRPANCLARR